MTRLAIPLAAGSLAFGLVLAAGCGSDDASTPAGHCGGVELVVAASDYASSVLCGAPTCELGPTTTGVDLGTDPQLTASHGRAFYLARDTDAIYEVDATCGHATARYSLFDARKVAGRTANPHDVAVAPDGALFVVLYNTASIAIVKDGRIDGTIDLSSYDTDGNPQADAIRIVDVAGVAKAFVTLERLDDADRLRSKQPSQMLRIDVATRQVEAVVELAGRNPFNPMAETAGRLYLAEPGNFDDAAEATAGIEAFDTATSTTKLLVAESALGGSVSEIAVTDGCGVAIVAGPAPNTNPTAVVTFDPTTGVVTARSAPLLGPTPGYDLQGLAWRGDTLYVGDRRPTAGRYPVHVFERRGAGCDLAPLARTIDLPQRPVALRSAESRLSPP